MKKILPMIALAAFAVGCQSQSYQHNRGGDANLRPTVVRDIAYEKFEISNKPITVKVIGSFLFGKIRLGSSVNDYADNVDQNKYCDGRLAGLRNQAYAAACAEAQCDSIVGARYEIKTEVNWFVTTITVTLTGYPSKLTGVELRPAVFDK